MPRFLNTWTGQFEFHTEPRDQVYAILSHTWRLDGREQSFQEVVRIQEEVDRASKRLFRRLWAHGAPSPLFSHPGLSDKIKGVCEVARLAGYRLVWIDSCCINKSDSVELSEAINSMYEWYRLSDMCYVYLSDVPDGDVPSEGNSRFQRSRWHRRVWTLQELIAPERAVFFTQTWNVLGTRMGLAATLENITGVDFDILIGKAELRHASVARRMSWAAGREAARVEDEAYSLMGIFGVHMTPIYGEGKNAFLRLQEEIIRTIGDQSIFAWGSGCVLRRRSAVKLECEPLGGCYPSPTWDNPGLLASSPSSFKYSGNIRVAQQPEPGADPSLRCTISSEGFCLSLRYLRLARPEITHLLDLMSKALRTENHGRTCQCQQLTDDALLVLLQCRDDDGYIALPLCRPRQECLHPRSLRVGTHIPCCADLASGTHPPYRTVRVDEEALKSLVSGGVEVKIGKVPNILRHLSYPPISKSLTPISDYYPDLHAWHALGTSTSGAFYISTDSVRSLEALGFRVPPLHGELVPAKSVTNPPLPGTAWIIPLTYKHDAGCQPSPAALELCIIFPTRQYDPTRSSTVEAGNNITILVAGEDVTGSRCRTTTCEPMTTHAIASVEFTLRSRRDSSPRAVTRLLRITLEHTLDHSALQWRDPASVYLCLFIDISQEHVSTRALEDVAHAGCGWPGSPPNADDLPGSAPFVETAQPIQQDPDEPTNPGWDPERPDKAISASPMAIALDAPPKGTEESLFQDCQTWGSLDVPTLFSLRDSVSHVQTLIDRSVPLSWLPPMYTSTKLELGGDSPAMAHAGIGPPHNLSISQIETSTARSTGSRDSSPQDDQPEAHHAASYVDNDSTEDAETSATSQPIGESTPLSSGRPSTPSEDDATSNTPSVPSTPIPDDPHTGASTPLLTTFSQGGREDAGGVNAMLDLTSRIADLTSRNAAMFSQNRDLSAKVALLSSQNVVLSAQVAELSSRMSDMLARLSDALTASQELPSHIAE